MKKLVALLLTFLFILVGCSKPEVKKIENKEEKTDAIRFQNEYKKVSKNNIYEYETYDNIMEILDEKTGIIYLGFPSCDLCQEITPILNDAAKERKVDKISYYNFKSIRQNNTNEYIKLVDKLDLYLNNDEEGSKRLTAPFALFVRKGRIVGLYKGALNSNQEEIITEEQKINLQNEFLSLIKKMQTEEDVTTSESDN